MKLDELKEELNNQKNRNDFIIKFIEGRINYFINRNGFINNNIILSELRDIRSILKNS